MGKISKEDGFKTPDGYFEGLARNIMDRMEEQDPKLPKTEGFKVPDGYFDKVGEKILSQKKETKVVRLYPYRKWLYTAASIAAVILIVIGLQWQGDQNLSFNDIANMELEAYFDDHATGISSYELAEVLELEELEVSDILEEDWSEENIVDYLDDTIEDLDELNLDYDE